MATLLAVQSSPRGDYSISRTLTKKFIEDWESEHTGGNVVMRDLVKTKLPFVDLPWIAGAYTPAEQHSPEIKEAISISNGLIAELMAADHIVIGTSMYNFSIPAILKAYIDHIVRVGVTFSPSYEGLVKGKKASVILASGGVYTPGARAESYNVASAYLKQILGFIGITDVTIVLAGGTSAIDKGEAKLPQFVEQFEPAVQSAAIQG